jgi:hypothetical protein
LCWHSKRRRPSLTISWQRLIWNCGKSLLCVQQGDLEKPTVRASTVFLQHNTLYKPQRATTGFVDMTSACPQRYPRASTYLAALPCSQALKIRTITAMKVGVHSGDDTSLSSGSLEYCTKPAFDKLSSLCTRLNYFTVRSGIIARSGR